MTVATISAVSAIAGQELARRQNGDIQEAPPMKLSIDTERVANFLDSVTLSGNDQQQTAQLSDFNRNLQSGNLVAIAAYQIFQPDTQEMDAPPDMIEPDAFISAELSQLSIDVIG